MEKTIKNKIHEDINLTYKVNNIDLNDIIIEKNFLPDYRLFDIEILAKEKRKNNYAYSIKISDFLKPLDHIILDVKIPVKTAINKNSLLKINDIIKISISTGNIEIIDSGKIKKILPDDRFIVQNTFGKLLECQRISDHLATMVIK